MFTDRNKNLKTKKLFDVLIVITFIIVIYAPAVGMILIPTQDISEIEKRTLAVFPRFTGQSLEVFLKEFEAYYNDHFGFRESLIYWNNYVKLVLLGVSPRPDTIVGKNGWLYLNTADMMRDYRGLIILSQQELEQWKNDLEAKRDWFKAHGIIYLFLIAPDKQSIHPENIPSQYTIIGHETRLDQLVAYLKENSDINIVDLRVPLLQARENELLYYETDTHWNSKGAYIAYQYIIEQLQEDFPNEVALDLLQLEETLWSRDGGDLDKNIGLPLERTHTTLDLINPCANSEQYLGPPLPSIRETEPIQTGCASAKLRAVVFRDSFFNQLIPFFSEHFVRSVYVWQRYSQSAMVALLEYVKPDIVIEEVVERSLAYPPPNDTSRIIANDLDSYVYHDLPRQILTINMSTGYEGIQPLHNATLIPLNGADGIELYASTSDPITLLPEVFIPSNTQAVLKLVITSPANTSVQFFYSTSSSPFSADRHVMRPIAAGKNEIFIRIYANDNITRLRLDPGLVPGNYVIHSVELRGENKL